MKKQENEKTRKCKKKGFFSFFHFFILSLLLLPLTTLAQEQVISQYPERTVQARQTEERLVGNYGLSVFLSCLDCPAYTKYNIFAWEKCLREAEYCLLGQNPPDRSCPQGQTASAGVCVSADTGCKERYGPGSYFNGSVTDNNYGCDCREEYVWDEGEGACVAPCPYGNTYYSVYQRADNSFIHPRCLTGSEICLDKYGENSRFVRQDDYGSLWCACEDGYEFNEEEDACVEAVVVAGIAGPDGAELAYIEAIEREKQATVEFDEALAARLSGRILLQVEEQGEAWYVNPLDQYRYYLATPAKALEVMRNLGLGADHDFITSYEYYPRHVRGRILIDVEDAGKAYYIDPQDGRAYYLGSPAMALAVLRQRGLGISNQDIRGLFVGE